MSRGELYLHPLETEEKYKAHIQSNVIQVTDPESFIPCLVKMGLRKWIVTTSTRSFKEQEKTRKSVPPRATPALTVGQLSLRHDLEVHPDVTTILRGAWVH